MKDSIYYKKMEDMVLIYLKKYIVKMWSKKYLVSRCAHVHVHVVVDL